MLLPHTCSGPGNAVYCGLGWKQAISMTKLTNLDLEGFKSIRRLRGLRFEHLNVLIGANGAGKSNLISFFKLLNWMTPSPGSLQFHVARSGGANALLHDGAAVTPQISATLTFETEAGSNQYEMRLAHAAGDVLIFADERVRFSRGGAVTETIFGSGHREASLIREAEQGNPTARTILRLLRRSVVYQFHDTSETARIRQKWRVDDDRFLKEDAANLAPFLHRLSLSRPRHYLRIVETIRQIAPFFADFVLDPEI